MNAIEIKGLTKRYNDKIVVDNLTFSIKEGELFALLGQNGAGKTTTIKMLSCLLLPNEGDALINGNSIVKDSMRVKQIISVSPQESAVAPNLTVRENLEFIARIYNISDYKKETTRIMDKFNLSERTNDRAKTLSGGLMHRLSIAMALITKPKIMFLDEPTLGLDVRARRDLWKILLELKGKITIILTTHYLEEAEALSDRIAIIDYGKLKVLGTAKEIEKETKTKNIEEAFLMLTEGE